jgi:hypothetical protein
MASAPDSNNDPLVVLRSALTTARDDLHRAQALVAKYERAIAVLEDDEVSHPSSPRAAAAVPDEGAGDDGAETMTAAATRVLREIGRPLHVKDIAERLASIGFGNRSARKVRASITRTLDRKAVVGSEISKPSPGHYQYVGATNNPSLGI